MPCACAVLALNCFTNSMMFTPCWPRAGPTGGAGVAWPPGTCSLIKAVTCLAMLSPKRNNGRLRLGAGVNAKPQAARMILDRFHLPVFQVHRHLPAEDR